MLCLLSKQGWLLSTPSWKNWKTATPVSNVSWITVTGGASGSGNGTVSYSVAANTGPERTGTLTVAGQTVVIKYGGAAMEDPALREEFARLHGEKVEVRHIQVADVSGLHEALNQLEKGADFAQVARAVSQKSAVDASTNPARSISALAADLPPIARMESGDGPMNTIPAAAQASAKSAFSLRNP